MPVIIIQNLRNKTIDFLNQNLTLLDILHGEGVDWMHSCGGKGNCTSCKFKIIRGGEYLNDKTFSEITFEKQNLLGSDERLACQVKVNSDLIIMAPNEFKLPHINYSD